MAVFAAGARMKLFAALLLSAAATVSAMPTEITAEYQVTNLGVKIGHVKESFMRKGDQYSIRSVTRSEGPLKMLYDDLVTVTSTGQVVEAGLRPLQFEQRRAKDGRRDVEASFDWDRGVVRMRANGATREAALPEHTQDRLSIMYQFMKVPVREGPLRIPMSNGRRLETYTYRFVGEERVSTPAGDFDALHFERVTVNAKQNRTDVWLAKERSNFPVRVVFDDPGGLRIEQSLVALQLR